MLLDRGWDHPRVCGEKQCVCRFLLSAVGSPPRMRGKESSCIEMMPPREDHPRVCGEKVHKVAGLGIVQGSPPRMRGKACEFEMENNIYRITPAYAGKRHTKV